MRPDTHLRLDSWTGSVFNPVREVDTKGSGTFRFDYCSVGLGLTDIVILCAVLFKDL